MPIKTKRTARIAVQMVIGKTKRNRTAHRTTYIRDVPVGLTDAEVLALVERHRPNFPYPIISKIRYQIIEDNIVWLDEENVQKMERRRLRLEKRAAREAAKAAKEAEKNTSEQTLLDFPEEIEETIEELTVETTSTSIAPQPEEEKEEEEHILPELVYPPGLEEKYKAIIGKLVGDAPAGSDVDVPYEKLVEAGFPADFLQAGGLRPGTTLLVQIESQPAYKKKKDAKQDKKNAAKEFKKEKGKRKQAAKSSKRNRKKK